ncbi:MAG: CotH kinase family protein, partial [Fibrobacter sp.]|nr:CotH kinase family protein [Fibrobacter sp.]
MNRVGSKCFFSHLLVLCVALALAVLNACDSGTDANAAVALTSSSKSKSSSSKKAYPDSFKPNDKEYPYANIPRIVIETENRTKIKDRETEIPAKLQIWGKKEAESEIVDLTIRGRGNTSWTDMPKKSYKIEFEKKQSMLGMPKDKDWALISNYADKTLMRNYIAYRLSATLGAYYAPRSEFAEL